jgi:hypothetical protein
MRSSKRGRASSKRCCRSWRTVVKEKTNEGSAVLVSLGKGEPIEVFEAKISVGALPKEIVEKFWV